MAALEALLGTGASVNGGEFPALCAAAMQGQVASAEALLAAGADVAATFHGKTAAEWAAREQQTAIVELLAHHSAAGSQSALHFSVKSGDVAMMRRMVELGAEVEAVNG